MQGTYGDRQSCQKKAIPIPLNNKLNVDKLNEFVYSMHLILHDFTVV